MYKLYKGNVAVVEKNLTIKESFEYYIHHEENVFIIKKPSIIRKAIAPTKPLLTSKEKIKRLNTLKEYRRIIKSIYNDRCVIQDAILNGENLDEIRLQSEEYIKH